MHKLLRARPAPVLPASLRTLRQDSRQAISCLHEAR